MGLKGPSHSKDYMNVSQVLELLDTVKDAETFKKRLVELENVRQVNASEYSQQVADLKQLAQDTNKELDARSAEFERQMKQRAMELEDKARKESDALNARFSRSLAQLEDARGLMTKALKLQDELNKKEQQLVEVQKQLQTKAIELNMQEQQLKTKAAKIQEVMYG